MTIGIPGAQAPMDGVDAALPTAADLPVARKAAPKPPQLPAETPRAKEEGARRKEREAAALRANLQKRRGQSQARAGDLVDKDPTGDPGKG